MARFFINRPIVAMVISILMVIIGLAAMVQLPIALYPNIAPPEILLTARYPGVDQVLTNLRYSQAASQLPPDVVNQGVSVTKSGTSPLGLFVLYSPKGTYDPLFLANYAYVNINDPMTRVSGIGQVQIFGAD